MVTQLPHTERGTAPPPTIAVYGGRIQACVRTNCGPCQLWPISCGQTAGCIRMPLGTEVGLGYGDIVLDGDPAPATERDTAALHFSAHKNVKL